MISPVEDLVPEAALGSNPMTAVAAGSRLATSTPGQAQLRPLSEGPAPLSAVGIPSIRARCTDRARLRARLIPGRRVSNAAVP